MKYQCNWDRLFVIIAFSLCLSYGTRASDPQQNSNSQLQSWQSAPHLQIPYPGQAPMPTVPVPSYPNPQFAGQYLQPQAMQTMPMSPISLNSPPLRVVQWYSGPDIQGLSMPPTNMPAYVPVVVGEGPINWPAPAAPSSQVGALEFIEDNNASNNVSNSSSTSSRRVRRPSNMRPLEKSHPIEIKLIKEDDAEPYLDWTIEHKKEIDSNGTYELLDGLYRSSKLTNKQLSDADLAKLDTMKIEHPILRLLAFLALNNDVNGRDTRKNILSELYKSTTAANLRTIIDLLKDFNSDHGQYNAFGVFLQHFKSSCEGLLRPKTSFNKLIEPLKTCKMLLDELIKAKLSDKKKSNTKKTAKIKEKKRSERVKKQRDDDEEAASDSEESEKSAKKSKKRKRSLERDKNSASEDLDELEADDTKPASKPKKTKRIKHRDENRRKSSTSKIKKKKKTDKEDDEDSSLENSAHESSESDYEENTATTRSRRRSARSLTTARPEKAVISESGEEQFVIYDIKASRSIENEETQRVLKKYHLNPNSADLILSRQDTTHLNESWLAERDHQMLALLAPKTTTYKTRKEILEKLGVNANEKESEYIELLKQINGRHRKLGAFGFLLQERLSKKDSPERFTPEFIEDFKESIKYVDGLIKEATKKKT